MSMGQNQLCSCSPAYHVFHPLWLIHACIYIYIHIPSANQTWQWQSSKNGALVGESSLKWGMFQCHVWFLEDTSWQSRYSMYFIMLYYIYRSIYICICICIVTFICIYHVRPHSYKFVYTPLNHSYIKHQPWNTSYLPQLSMNPPSIPLNHHYCCGNHHPVTLPLPGRCSLSSQIDADGDGQLSREDLLSLSWATGDRGIQHPDCVSSKIGILPSEMGIQQRKAVD